MGLYSLDEYYGVDTWYDYTGAFDLWAGTDLLLEQTRHIIASDAYVCQCVAFPKGTDTEFAFQGTFSGSLNLIPYSYIVGINGWSSASNLTYVIRIYDKGGQTDLYYGQFAWDKTVTGQYGQTLEGLGVPYKPVPIGAYFFRDPLIVLPPGNLQIQITNSSFGPISPTQLIGDIQLLFMVAVPKNTTALNTRRVQTASDPSGIQSMGALASLIPGIPG